MRVSIRAFLNIDLLGIQNPAIIIKKNRFICIVVIDHEDALFVEMDHGELLGVTGSLWELWEPLKASGSL